MYCANYYTHGKFKTILEKVLSNNIEGFESLEILSDGDEYHPSGYIDHQSCDDFLFNFSSEEILKEFLISNNSILVIENDNH